MEANTELEKKESNNQGGQEVVRGVQASPARNQLDRVRDQRTVAKYGEFHQDTEKLSNQLQDRVIQPQRLRPARIRQHFAQASSTHSGLRGPILGIGAVLRRAWDISGTAYHQEALDESVFFYGIRSLFQKSLPTSQRYYFINDESRAPEVKITSEQAAYSALERTAFNDENIRLKINHIIHMVAGFQLNCTGARIDSPVQQVAMDLREQLTALATESNKAEAWERLKHLSAFLKVIRNRQSNLQTRTDDTNKLFVLVRDLIQEIEGSHDQQAQYQRHMQSRNNDPLALLLSREVSHQSGKEALAEKVRENASVVTRFVEAMASFLLPSGAQAFNLYAYPANKEEKSFAQTPIGGLFNLLKHLTSSVASNRQFAVVPGVDFNIFVGKSLDSLCLIRDPQVGQFAQGVSDIKIKRLLILEPQPYQDVFSLKGDTSSKSDPSLLLVYPKRQQQNYQMFLPQELHVVAEEENKQSKEDVESSGFHAFKALAIKAIEASVSSHQGGLVVNSQARDSAIAGDYAALKQYLADHSAVKRVYQGNAATLIYTPGFFLLRDPETSAIHAIRGKVTPKQDWVASQCRSRNVLSHSPVHSIKGHLTTMDNSSLDIQSRLNRIVDIFGALCEFSAHDSINRDKKDMFEYTGECVAVQHAGLLDLAMQSEDQLAQLLVSQLRLFIVDIQLAKNRLVEQVKDVTALESVRQKLSRLQEDFGKVPQRNTVIRDIISDLVGIAPELFQETLHNFEDASVADQVRTAATFGQEPVTPITRKASLPPAFAQPAPVGSPPAYTASPATALPSAPPASEQDVSMPLPQQTTKQLAARRTSPPGLPNLSPAQVTHVEDTRTPTPASPLRVGATTVPRTRTPDVQAPQYPQYQPIEQPAEPPATTHKVTDYKIPTPSKNKFYTYIRNTSMLTGAIMLLVGSLAAAGALPGIATFFAASAVPLMLAGAGVFFVTLFFTPEKDTTLASIKRWAARMSLGVFALSIVALAGSLPALTAGLAAAAAPLVVVGLLLLAVAAFSEGIARSDHSVKEVVHDLDVAVKGKLVDENVPVKDFLPVLGPVQGHLSQETQDKLQEPAPE